MYDLANQSFQLLINTLLFGVFVAQVVAITEERGKSAWTAMIVAAELAVVALSPLVGALADARSWKKEVLVVTGLVAGMLTAALTLLGPGMIWQAAALYIVAAIAVGIGENFLGAFLPELARPEQMGRVSATGWTMSYIGALLLLAMLWILHPVLGLDDPANRRWLFLISGVWFLAGILPVILLLRERTPPRPESELRNIASDALSQLRESWRESARFLDLRRFFLAGFVYSMGVNTVIFFAGLIGAQFGFGLRQLTLLAIVMSLGAGAGALFDAKFQDRIGHRRTVLLFLGVWTLSTLAMAVMSLRSLDLRIFWIIAAGLGLGLGGIGTGSRALVGALTPAARSGEFFGVWGLVFKLSAVVGVGTFGAVAASWGQPASLFALSAFFIAGALLMLRVDERRGMAAARDFA